MPWNCAMAVPLSFRAENLMAAPRIKKKSSGSKTSAAIPRQGLVPCLILLLIAFAVIVFFFFAGFHITG